ncbi:MAG: tetratricopeptide repeat protein, partial [Paenibacillus sp.]|nr:tetratricopeptide repeat protein [Paenibacillus sp.]
MTTSENLDAPQAKAMSKNDLLILAERLTVMRDYVEAATTWAKLKPFTEPMHAFKYVTCLLGAGLMTEAENSLVESLEIFPNRYDLHRLYAQRLVARDEMERAARHYNYLRNRWQNLESAWLDEIKILLSLKRDQQARDLLATAVTIFPDSMECARLHAESECKKHDWVEALKKWSIFRQKFSSSPIGWRRAIDICVSHRDFVEADRLASEMHSDSIAISGSFFIRKKQGSPHVLIIFSAFDIKLGDWPGGQKFCD